MNFHFASVVAPGTRLVVAIAPAFTIGLVRPVDAAFDRRERVERQPGGVGADLRAKLLGAELLAHQREHERLRHAHDREFVLGVADAEDVAARPDHADAEQIARHPRQRRVDVRVLALGVRLEALVGLGHQHLHGVGRRQASCRYKRLVRCRAAPASVPPVCRVIDQGDATAIVSVPRWAPAPCSASLSPPCYQALIGARVVT